MRDLYKRVTVTNSENIKKFCQSNNIPLAKFNFPVDIPSDVTDCSYMFSGCSSFNQPVDIPANAIDCGHMFSGCSSFNQPVDIPANAIDCSYMFSGCSSFNQPVNISSNTIECRYMFNNCSSFNQPIKILSKTTTNCAFMFQGCKSLNQSIILDILDTNYDYNSINFYGIFSGCHITEPIIIVSVTDNLTNLFQMLLYQYNFLNDLYIQFPDEVIIEKFNELLNISHQYHQTEMTARLLQFKHDHWDEFPNNDFNLDNL